MVKNILNYLENSVEEAADKTAFADEGSSCTYTELMRDAKTIGSVLTSVAEPRMPVPVFMEKSVQAVTTFLGTAYAGCFYVMIDIHQPRERILQIQEVLAVDYVVTSRKYEELVHAAAVFSHIYYIEDMLLQKTDEKILESRRLQMVDLDPLYGIFTSGSTGVPKSVIVSHQSVVDFIDNFTEIFHITEEDVIGNQAPFDFDVSVKDIYSTLKTHATMQIIPTKLFSIPVQLLDFLEERKVTTLVWAVSALCIVTTLRGFDYKIPSGIQKVLFSGEVMPIKHLNRWREAYPKAMFVNLYGPTEITCNCTYYIVDREFEKGDTLPMGQPFPNKKILLLDEDKLVTKPEQQGEICVAGRGLALGYYNNEEQTKKVFVQNPLNPYYQERIYRTGDLARFNADGELCFVGRKDFQIKHMGHRIELGEIEMAMEQVENLGRCCCIYNEKNSRITAFYSGSLEKKELAAKLKEKLPVYMIPNRFIQMEALPITKNGKIDRKSLKEQV